MDDCRLPEACPRLPFNTGAVLRGLVLTVGLTFLAGCQTVGPGGPLGGLAPDQLAVKSEQVCLPRQSQPSCFYKQDPTGKQTKLIVFVHGVFGRATSTWGDPADETFWPAMVAADGRFVDYDIYLMNYRTPYLMNAPNIYETAGSELSHLRDRGTFKQYTDLHFIGHSMGGLVIKSMLLRLTSGPNLNMLRQVKSAIYLSTPAQGSSVASFWSWFSMNPQLRDMERAHLNTFIQSLEDQWVQLMISRDEAKIRFPRVHCAYETLGTNGVLIVPREMANTRCDGLLHPMPFDHSGMVTPTRRDADPYLWVMKRILEATEEDDVRKKAAGLLVQAEQLRSTGYAQQARAAYTEASMLYKEVEDRRGEAQVLRGLADLERTLNHNDQARAAYTGARMLYKEVEDRRGEAQVLRGLGELERVLDRHDQARAAYTEARTLFKEVESRYGEATVLLGLGDLERMLSHDDQARAAYAKARMLYKSVEDRRGEANVLLGLGRLEATLKHPELARQHLFQSAGLFEAIGMSDWKEIALAEAKNLSR